MRHLQTFESYVLTNEENILKSVKSGLSNLGKALGFQSKKAGEAIDKTKTDSKVKKKAKDIVEKIMNRPDFKNKLENLVEDIKKDPSKFSEKDWEAAQRTVNNKMATMSETDFKKIGEEAQGQVQGIKESFVLLNEEEGLISKKFLEWLFGKFGLMNISLGTTLLAMAASGLTLGLKIIGASFAFMSPVIMALVVAGLILGVIGAIGTAIYNKDKFRDQIRKMHGRD